jgi:hypothetical protein
MEILILAPSLATMNGLMKATQTEVALTPAAAALMSRPTVVIRRIAASTFRALFPVIPREITEALSADPERAAVELRERELLWLETAPAAARVAYRLDLEQVKVRAVALCLVEPRMSEAEVDRLGDEILPVYQRLLEFSGLLAAPVIPEPAASGDQPA